MRSVWVERLVAATLLAIAMPAIAQVRSVDPNAAMTQDSTAPLPDDSGPTPLPPPMAPDPAAPPPPVTAPTTTQNATQAELRPAVPVSNTYRRDDIVGAAENTFGKGAAGLAGMIEKILSDQGEPNAYIAGSEAAGAALVGLRYGKGVLSHRVEGQQPIYWTGPSIGLDVGGDAAKVFVLVYNLYDSHDLYKRFPAAEGRLYLVGGFAATYLRRGNIVLIPVRLGIGYRAGVNVGYMRFSEKARWLPF